jgi:hypothetical protein
MPPSVRVAVGLLDDGERVHDLASVALRKVGVSSGDA